MDRGQIALKLSMESLGLPFSIKTFEERLMLQKAVYLVQAAGVHLGVLLSLVSAWTLQSLSHPRCLRHIYGAC